MDQDTTVSSSPAIGKVLRENQGSHFVANALKLRQDTPEIYAPEKPEEKRDQSAKAAGLRSCSAAASDVSPFCCA